MHEEYSDDIWNDIKTEETMTDVMLYEYKADKRKSNNNRRNNDGLEEDKRDENQEPVRVIRTIYGGSYYFHGDWRQSQKNCAREAKEITPEDCEYLK